MNIAILGAGNVGGTLGKRWAQNGHQIVYVSREPTSEKMWALLAETPGGTATDHILAASIEADAILLATPWAVVPGTLTAAGNLSGKVLLDATNPIGPGLALLLPAAGSGGQEVAHLSPGARVVKIFNTTGWGNMADPLYGGESTALFLCGDDATAKGVAAALAEELGFAVADVGGLDKAHLLEAVALTWINLAMVQGHGRDIAFKIVKRG